MTDILTDFYLPQDIDAASGCISNTGLLDGLKHRTSQFRFCESDVTNSNNHQASSNFSSLNSRILTEQFYKTRMCPFHARGNCRNGLECTYAHGTAELKHAPDLFKTKLCEKWQSKNCFNTECRYAHGRHELRYTDRVYKTRICHFWFTGDCNKGKLCRHAHGLTELHSMVKDSNFPSYPNLYQQNNTSILSTVEQKIASKFNILGESEKPVSGLSVTNKCLALNNLNNHDFDKLLLKPDNTSINQFQLPASLITDKKCQRGDEIPTSNKFLLPQQNWYDKSQSCRVSEGCNTIEGSPRHWTSSEPALSTSNSGVDMDLMQQLVDSINELTTEDKVQYQTIASEI